MKIQKYESGMSAGDFQSEYITIFRIGFIEYRASAAGRFPVADLQKQILGK
ncbi:hypothetical protein D3C71_2252960 [compost metagenome]